MKNVFNLQRTLSRIKVEIHEIMWDNGISWEDLAVILDVPVESLKTWDNDQWRYVTISVVNQLLDGLEFVIAAKKDRAKQEALATLGQIKATKSE